MKTGVLKLDFSAAPSIYDFNNVNIKEIEFTVIFGYLYYLGKLIPMFYVFFKDNGKFIGAAHEANKLKRKRLSSEYIAKNFLFYEDVYKSKEDFLEKVTFYGHFSVLKEYKVRRD